MPWIFAAAFAFLLVFPWQAPANDLDLSTFDPHLITPVTRARGLSDAGAVSIEPGVIRIDTRPFSQPTVHLLTTEAPAFTVALVARVEQASGQVYPLQIRVWNPVHDLAVELWMDVAGGNVLSVGDRRGSAWIRSTQLMAGGAPLSYQVVIDRSACAIRVSVVNEAGARGGWLTTCADFPELFRQDTLSVSLSSTGLGGAAALTRYTDPRIVLPHQTLYGSGSDDPRLPLAAGAVAILAGLTLLAGIAGRPEWLAGRWRLHRIPPSTLGALLVIVLSGGALVVVGSWLGNHPYDAYSQGAWAYLADHYGPGRFYPLSMITPEGFSHGGDPFQAVTLAYPPFFLVVLGLAGRMVGLLDPNYGPTSPSLGLVIKGVHFFAILLASGVIGLSGVASRRFLVPLFLLDLGLLADVLLWGQLDAELVLFLIASVVALHRRRLSTMLACLAFSFLVKQTALMWAPWVVLIAWRILGLRPMVRAAPRALAVVALFLAPLFIQGLSPSSLWVPTLYKGLQWNTVEHKEASSATVTTDSFNLWPLLTGIAGTRGAERLVEPDTDTIGSLPITYFSLSRILAVLLAGAGLLMVLRTPRRVWKRHHVVYLGLGILFLLGPLVLTRMSSRYLLPGAVMLAASWATGGGTLAALAWLGISVTVAFSIIGLLAQIAGDYPALLPNLNPAANPAAAVVAQLHSNDVFISMACLVVLASFLLVVWRFFMERRRHRAGSGNSVARVPRLLRQPRWVLGAVAMVSIIAAASAFRQAHTAPVSASNDPRQVVAGPPVVELGRYVFLSGFYPSEGQGVAFPRWTDGHGVLLFVNRQAGQLTVQARLVQPDFGIRRARPDLTLYLDGAPVEADAWSVAQDPPGFFTVGVDLGVLPSGATLHTLRLASPSFVPYQRESGSTDGRHLGVRLEDVALAVDGQELVPSISALRPSLPLATP